MGVLAIPIVFCLFSVTIAQLLFAGVSMQLLCVLWWPLCCKSAQFLLLKKSCSRPSLNRLNVFLCHTWVRLRCFDLKYKFKEKVTVKYFASNHFITKLLMLNTSLKKPAKTLIDFKIHKIKGF